MGVTTNLINKPLNPRAQDASPLAYNRAALYSGKALDFDGVNDYLTFDGFAGTLSNNDAWTACGYFKTAGVGRKTWFSAHDSSGGNILRIGTESGNESGLFYADNYQFDTQIGDFDFRDDKMHFVVLSRAQGANGSLATLFVDGIELATQVTGPNWDTATKFSLGQEWDGGSASDFWDGLLSNFKIFNTALTAAQIADLYNNPEKIVPTGVDNTALKLWLPMMEGAGTTAINGAPDALGDELFTQPIDLTAEFSTNGGGIIVDANTFTTAGGSFDGIRANNILTTGKVYVLKIEGSTTSSGFTIGDVQTSGSEYGANFGIYYFKAVGHTLWIRQTTAGTTDLTTLTLKELKDVGTISGATWTHGIGASVAQTSVIDWNKHSFDVNTDILIPQGLNAGRDIGGNLFENVRKQGALNLDGQSWAEVHKNDSVPEGGEDRTMEVWVYHKPQTTYQSFIELGEKTNFKRFGILSTSIAAGNHIYIAGQGYDTNTQVSYNTNAWNHIVVTLESGTQKVYKNGVSISDLARPSYNTTLDTIEIGRNKENLTEYSYSTIAQPRIYNRALSAEEIQRNYNAGKNIYS